MIMKKQFYLFFLLLLCSGELIAQKSDNNSSLDNYLQVEGLLRYFTMVRKYEEYPIDTSPTEYQTKRSSNAVGLQLALQTKPLHHWSVGAAVYTSQPIFNNPKDEGGLQLLQNDQSGFTVLGEAFVQYQDKYNLFKIGRQKLSDYRFLADCDVRMAPNTYEAAIIENRKLQDITLRAAVVSGVKKVASTEFIDFINASKNLFREEPIQRNPIRGDYDPNNYDENGNYIGPRENLYLASMVYKTKKYSYEIWNYFVPDFVNFFYTTATYNFHNKLFKNSISFQYVQQNDVGKHVAGNINTYEYGVHFQSTYKNLQIIYAFNKVKYDENSLDGGSIIDMWGNDILYGGLFENGADQAGTVANTIIVSYDMDPFTVAICAGHYDLPNNMQDLFAEQDNNEYDLFIKYNPKWNKNLMVKTELIYVDFDTSYDFKTYEELHGYDTLHSYDNILDMRFVVNYTF